MQKQLTHRLVVPDGGDLRAEHDGGEEGEEEPLEDEEEEEDDGGGRRRKPFQRAVGGPPKL